MGDPVSLSDLCPPSVMAEILRTGRTARVDDYAQATGQVAELARTERAQSTVACPIIVEGRVWGALGVASRLGPLPAETEQRIMDFTELVATAIANAESRGQLTASRARVVAAADEARRRIERDLHDGIQQRLVSLSLSLSLSLAPRVGGQDPAGARRAESRAG
jgi:GAF domain-containing protein